MDNLESRISTTQKILTGVEVISPLIAVPVQKLLGMPAPKTPVGKMGRAISYARMITTLAFTTGALTAWALNTGYDAPSTPQTHNCLSDVHEVHYTAQPSSLYVHSDNNF